MIGRNRLTQIVTEAFRSILIIGFSVGLFGLLAYGEQYQTLAIMALVGCLWLTASVVQLVSPWLTPEWLFDTDTEVTQ